MVCCTFQVRSSRSPDWLKDTLGKRNRIWWWNLLPRSISPSRKVSVSRSDTYITAILTSVSENFGVLSAKFDDVKLKHSLAYTHTRLWSKLSYSEKVGEINLIHRQLCFKSLNTVWTRHESHLPLVTGYVNQLVFEILVRHPVLPCFMHEAFIKR